MLLRTYAVYNAHVTCLAGQLELSDLWHLLLSTLSHLEPLHPRRTRSIRVILLMVGYSPPRMATAEQAQLELDPVWFELLLHSWPSNGVFR